MDLSVKDLETTARDVLGKLNSRQPFQSKWDTAAFIIFLVFVSAVFLLLLLAGIHCCCCTCCSRRPPRSQKVSPKKQSPRGVDNLALEP